MGFTAAIREAFRKYFIFTGRATRPEYWWFTLFTAICNLIGQILNVASGTSVISTIILLPLLIPHIAVAFRRLHDTNRSGWNYGAIFILMFAGSFLLMLLKVLGIAVMIAAGVMVVANVVFFCTAGTPGDNSYGPLPPTAPVIPAPK